MIPLETFLNKIRYVKLSDMLSFVKFAVAFPISKVMRIKYRNVWLICEDGLCACDNGYAFFEFLVKEHTEQSVIYVIDKKAKDFEKVKKLGKVVQQGSLLHWIFYLTASQNISSQKSGKPNAAVCYFLEVGGFLKNSRVFLQHGITINDSKWIYYPETKFSLFVCGAKPEYEYVKENFQYPEGYVQYLGFPRFDKLHDIKCDKHTILIMPTWRRWLTFKLKNEDGVILDFEQSEYFIKWNSLLNNRILIDMLEKYGLKIVFCPHRNAQKYIKSFQPGSSKIVITQQSEYDIQKLLIDACFMITDYSSVFFDFIYMKKPVLFYQFDEERFRNEQLQKGYFDYNQNPFAEVCNTEDELITRIENFINSKFTLTAQFLNAHEAYFPLYDNCNSERIYQAIKKLK